MVATEEPTSSSWMTPAFYVAVGAIGGAAVSFAAGLHGRRQLVQLEAKVSACFEQLSIDKCNTEQVNRNLEQLRRIFYSPKERGTFGETQLESLIRNALPPKGYEFQASLSNKKIADCVLRLPSPIGKLAVDSKFPLESFREEEQEHEHNALTRINGSSATSDNNSEYEARRLKQQKESLRRHINDIAGKYIIKGETADCAILFLPSESIFRQVVTYHQDVWSESIGKRVWVTSPSTLMAIITTMQGVTRGLALQEDTEEMYGHVKKLTGNADLLLERFEKAEKSIDNAKEALGRMNISIGKIRKTRDALDVMDGFLPKRYRKVRR